MQAQKLWRCDFPPGAIKKQRKLVRQKGERRGCAEKSQEENQRSPESKKKELPDFKSYTCTSAPGTS